MRERQFHQSGRADEGVQDKKKVVVFSSIAQHEFRDVVAYLQANWPPEVVIRFQNMLDLKLELIYRHPAIGFKSSKFSKFRKTLIGRHYMLIYSINYQHIVILRLKHTLMKK